MRYKVVFTKFKGLNHFEETESASDIIKEFVKQNNALKIRNIFTEDNITFGKVQDLDGFDYGMIIIKEVAS
jgi:hypothetical protein